LKKKTLFLGLFFYRVYFPSYRKFLPREWNPEQFVGVVAFVLVISSSKLTALVLALFFYRA
jgi:hypothetical protein